MKQEDKAISAKDAVLEHGTNIGLLKDEIQSLTNSIDNKCIRFRHRSISIA